VTHDQVEAMTLADRILLLNAGDAVQREGSVAQCGSPLDLYHRPRTRFVAGFIGSPKMNFLPGTLQQADASRALVRLPGGEMLEAAVDARRLPPGVPVTLGLRPEHAELAGVVQASQRLVRTVAWQERLGESTWLYLDSGTPGEPWVVKAPGSAHATPGQRIAFGLPATALHLFDDQGLALPRCVPDTDVALPMAA
jgi:multiple sugar transport system ATP-binding protein